MEFTFVVPGSQASKRKSRQQNVFSSQWVTPTGVLSHPTSLTPIADSEAAYSQAGGTVHPDDPMDVDDNYQMLSRPWELERTDRSTDEGKRFFLSRSSSATPSSPEYSISSTTSELNSSTRPFWQNPLAPQHFYQDFSTGSSSIPVYKNLARSPLSPLSPNIPHSNSKTTPAEPTRRVYKGSKHDRILGIMKTLQEMKMNVLDLLLEVLIQPDDEIKEDSYKGFRNGLLSTKCHGRFDKLLTFLLENKQHELMHPWMEPHAIQFVCDKISREMEAAKPQLTMHTTDVTLKFIEEWDINQIMDGVAKVTPTWCTILDAATEPQPSKPKAKTARSRNRELGRHFISAQAHFLRSYSSAKVQIGLGLMAWSTGASRQLVDVMHHSCLTVSYTGISNVLSWLAERAMQLARLGASIPHSLAYDNVNVSSSIFVEQAPSAMNKVRSGTFAVIYKLANANIKHMEIGPLMANLAKASPLQLSDLRPSLVALQSYMKQSTIHITQVLFKYVAGFNSSNDLRKSPQLQHPSRRRLPPGHKTEFYPTRASTIEEASVNGNLRVHDDLYVTQLQKDVNNTTFNSTAIPSFNDQLTNARIRSCQALRRKDVTPWERRELIQLGFGVFHMVMNYLWCLLHTHRGTLQQVGSLTHLFAVLEKTRLGNEHPDYHTLLSALTQILDGLLLNAWINECGHPSLDAFSKSEPTADDILRIAKTILEKYTIPDSRIEPTNARYPPKDIDTPEDANVPPPVDIIHQNVILLTRDLLIVKELTDAMSSGDIGRIEDILPTLACMFRAAGSNNYSNEILFFLFNLKEVWTPEFANIMRDNMLVNPSGLDGHAMAIDLNIEHLIGYLKGLFVAKGIYSNWDRLGNISAAINYIQLVKKQVTRSVRASYRGSSHKGVDTSALVWRIAGKAKQLKLQEQVVGREDNKLAKSVIDLQAVGYRKFETASLATFNAKIADMQTGLPITLDVDEIVSCSMGIETQDSDSNGMDLNHINELTVLHDDTV
ncbi:hypothetical protein CVT24_009900 [Panaeolus cyanescens]|uniref:DUF6589 domain-containing protein n=1 Tax=Panaeolus cyanescens TaxID=181874 RepID=A0A409WS10_9AGAR|nr:hypothetical protein CVT24_009900 [Panaeolus cyanescens]